MAVLPRKVCYIRLNSVSGDNENKPTWSLTFYTIDVVGQTTFISPSYASRSSPRIKMGSRRMNYTDGRIIRLLPVFITRRTKLCLPKFVPDG